MTPYDIPAWIVLAWLFVLGSVIGSFLNVCVHRIPQHETLGAQLSGLWSPPSRCPRCLTRIQLRDNVPIFGWLFLGGKCRQCRAPISWRYPAIELLNGLLFVVVYWAEVPFELGAMISESRHFTNFGLERSSFWSPVAVVHWRYAFHMILIEAMLVASLIDLDEMLIPDASTVPAMIAGILIAAAVPQVHLAPVWFTCPAEIRSFGILLPDWLRAWTSPPDAHGFSRDILVPAWISAYPHLHGLAASLVGMAVGGGVVWGVRIIGHAVLRREAMGFGDVVLMGMIGIFLGWQATVAVFFVAPVFALAMVVASWMVRRAREIPYGPYLSLGALAVILGWPKVWPPVERIAQLGVLVPLMGIVMAVMLAVCLVLMQGAKRLLGIPLYPAEQEEYEDVWSSADTLAHLAGENTDRFQGKWRTSDWPGIAAGQGTARYESWRFGR